MDFPLSFGMEHVTISMIHLFVGFLGRYLLPDDCVYRNLIFSPVGPSTWDEILNKPTNHTFSKLSLLSLSVSGSLLFIQKFTICLSHSDSWAYKAKIFTMIVLADAS